MAEQAEKWVVICRESLFDINRPPKILKKFLTHGFLQAFAYATTTVISFQGPMHNRFRDTKSI